MEEYLSYSLSAQGQLFPVVSILRPGPQSTSEKPVYRDLGREDILRIPDSKPVPGSWLYKRGTATSSSGAGTLNAWTRRFALLRGSYLFFFHNPQSDKPLFLVPLSGCEVVVPADDAKSFDDTAQRRLFKANEGYEFEIQSKGNKFPPVRLYSVYEQERDEWVASIEDRSIDTDDISQEISSESETLEGSPTSGTVVITKTKLIGESPIAADLINSDSNAYKLFSDSSRRIPMSTISGNIVTYSPFSTPGGVGNLIKEGIVDIGDIAKAVSAENANAEEDLVQRRVTVQFSDLIPTEDNEEKEIEPPVDPALLARLMVKQEARDRQAEARARASSRQSIDAARMIESDNPMTLSEIFRVLLFFAKEELVDEPRPEVASQIPHLKGEWSENLMITVYQYYCGDNGYMTLEQFIEFIDDSGILQTHAPRDDSDEPNSEYSRQLDPAELITSIPQDLGQSIGKPLEPLTINFFIFFQMLLRIAHIVYPELAEENEAHAMNKLIFESLCPLYAWCKGHSKRGSTDVLVLEDRIPLLMFTYASNLWRVFLMYAQDVVGKTQNLTATFPDEAMINERGMHGLLPGVPCRAKTEAHESLIITEAACLRFASDYALCPHLLGKAEIRELFCKTNREKNLKTTKLSVRDKAPTNAALLRLEAVNERLTRFRETSTMSAMYAFNPEGNIAAQDPVKKAAEVARAAEAMRKAGKGSSQALSNIDNKGLSFSEFVEFIARLALEGMEQETFSVLFPTPFSKVLAILTVWGVADLRKVEELRVLQTTKVI